MKHRGWEELQWLSPYQAYLAFSNGGEEEKPSVTLFLLQGGRQLCLIQESSKLF
jgi:hypothetical protein